MKDKTWRHWTKDEDNFLIENYQKNAIEMSQKLNRSIGAIYGRVRYLGLSDKGIWSVDDDKFLIEHYNKLDIVKIADLLGRTLQSIRYRAFILGVTKYNTITSVGDDIYIKSINDCYEITSDGKVLSKYGRHKTELKTIIRSGYKRVKLSIDGKMRSYTVHRLVAESFIPNPDNKPTVNHIDGDKLNNHVSNLEWATNKEQSYHAIESGLTRYNTNKTLAKQIKEESGTYIDIAKKYNVSRTTVANIKKNKTWGHI